MDASPAVYDTLEPRAHVSQQAWLDETQGFGSFVGEMDEMSRTIGDMSGRYEVAEGWRRHSHLGFSARDQDPLAVALADVSTVDEGCEKSLLGAPFRH